MKVRYEAEVFVGNNYCYTYVSRYGKAEAEHSETGPSFISDAGIPDDVWALGGEIVYREPNTGKRWRERNGTKA